MKTTKRISWSARKNVRAIRPGSKRAKLAELLAKKAGATRAELQKAIGWDAKTLYDGLRLLHVFVGLGVKEDERGKLRLVGAPAKSE